MVVIVDDNESKMQEIRSELLDGVADEIKDIDPPADFRASIECTGFWGLRLVVFHTNHLDYQIKREYYISHRTANRFRLWRLEGRRYLQVNHVEGLTDCPYSQRFANEVAKRVTQDIVCRAREIDSQAGV